MKDSKKMFILMEGILAALVILLVMVMFWGRNGEEREKVSVIIQNADDSQWSAFKYGLRMSPRRAWAPSSQSWLPPAARSPGRTF